MMQTQDLAKRIQQQESFLLANDGQYLGKLSLNRFDSDSIMNQYGLYGNPYSSTSIFNKYSNYGSPYSSLSPFNFYTSMPPTIYLYGQIIGFLTKNPYLGQRNVDPDDLILWMQNNNLNY